MAVIASVCSRIDSRSPHQGRPESTKTSLQKRPRLAVTGISGTDRNKNTSAKFRRNTRYGDSHSIKSLRRGWALRWVVLLYVKSPEPLSINTRGKGGKN